MISRLPSAAALVLAFIVFFGYVSPTYSGDIAKLRQTIAREQESLNAAARFGEKQDELASARNAIAPADLTRLETLLPSSVDNVGAILDLTSLATRSNVQLMSISVAAPPATNSLDGAAQTPIGVIDLSISVTGGYSSFLTFLAGIERSLRILDIVSLGVTGSDTGVYTYEMTIRLYWLR